MKQLLLFTTLSLVLNDSIGQKIDREVIGSTNQYEFYSDYWINLHHFLYQKADSSQLKRLQRDGKELVDIGEKELYQNLSSEQKRDIDRAIEYYRQNIVKRHLIRGLGFERVWLQELEPLEVITDTTYSSGFTEALNLASKVYKSTFWPLHNQRNRDVLNVHLSAISEIQGTVIPKMEALSMTKWPSAGKVRIDLTAYANYAGAYTPARPKFNIFIATLDPDIKNHVFIETVFHESSHLLFRYGGSFREGISEIFNESEFDMKYPGGLWHASLFYLCGRIIQEELRQRGVSDYIMYMDARNVYSDLNTSEFREAMELYYLGESDFRTTIVQVLKDMQ